MILLLVEKKCNVTLKPSSGYVHACGCVLLFDVVLMCCVFFGACGLAQSRKVAATSSDFDSNRVNSPTILHSPPACRSNWRTHRHAMVSHHIINIIVTVVKLLVWWRRRVCVRQYLVLIEVALSRDHVDEIVPLGDATQARARRGQLHLHRLRV